MDVLKALAATNPVGESPSVEDFEQLLCRIEHQQLQADRHPPVRQLAPVPAAHTNGAGSEPFGRGIRARLGARLRRPALAPRSSRKRRLARVLGGSALCAALATGILIALAPGSGSSDFLARAAAELVPPPGAILYERWEHLIALEPENPLSREARAFGPDQLWMQDGPPHAYRAILEPGQQAASEPAFLANTYGVNLGYGSATGGNALPNYLLGRLAGRQLELGGALEGPEQTKAHPNLILPTLTLVAPHELLSAHLRVTLGATLPGPHDDVIENGVDPVGALRSAIAEGRAHEAGTAQLNGRIAERIDFDLPDEQTAEGPAPADAPGVHREAYAYVEPETFDPLEIVFGLDTYRFLAYQYLPASEANLALTSMQAQHPGASIVQPGPAAE